jgi:MFS family permease
MGVATGLIGLLPTYAAIGLWAPVILTLLRVCQGLGAGAELFGSRVRYSGFAASRELGAALVGFSPLISAALVGALDGRPWLVAAWMMFTAAVSLVAFLFSAETRDIDIAESDPVQAGSSGPPRSGGPGRWRRSLQQSLPDQAPDQHQPAGRVEVLGEVTHGQPVAGQDRPHDRRQARGHV